jgi:hypothetical protein
VSEALEATVSDLLAASEQAAQIIGERAKLDLEALRRTATQLTELVKALGAEVDQLGMEPRPAGEDRPSAPRSGPVNASPQFDPRALLILLNMASNGASRSEAADYLAENLDLRDCDELLGAVYSYVDSTRAGPRERKPSSEGNGATPRD